MQQGTPRAARAHQPSADAFTLVELLVVLIIVALLAAVLTSLFHKVHAAGQRTTCSYNLHTLGLSLAAYANDKQTYPYKSPLVAGLIEDGYLSSSAAADLVCPLDTSDAKDTYSIGYLGGYPNSSSDNDPLIVCGWHRNLGVLAVYPDQRVDLVRKVAAPDISGADTSTGATAPSAPAASSGGSTSTAAATLVPVTFSYNGRTQTVQPGFVLPTNGLVVNSMDGKQAVLYGDNRQSTYLISASYDPTANNGAGMFSVNVGFNSATGVTDPQLETKSTSNTAVEVVMRLGYMAVQMISNPSRSSTKLEFQYTKLALLENDTLKLQDYALYKVTHILTGQVAQGTATGSTAVQLNATNVTLVKTN